MNDYQLSLFVRGFMRDECSKLQPIHTRELALMSIFVDIRNSSSSCKSKEIQALRNDNNRMRGQITEALAILLNGSDYDKVHLEAILENAIDKAKGKT